MGPRRLGAACASLAITAGLLAAASVAHAQGASTTPAAPRPWGRLSFFTNSSTVTLDDGATRRWSELSTAFAYQLPDVDSAGADYGLDIRYATYAGMARPSRTSIYEGFAGGRFHNGLLRVRAGHLSLTDVGSLGALAGTLIEGRRPHRQSPNTNDAPVGHTRLGLFAGLDPNVLDMGYSPGVTKVGAYIATDDGGLRRHSAGYVVVRHGRLTERSVITASNAIPFGTRAFVYQAAEFNVQAPGGVGARGLAYVFANARATASRRVELQGTYNRGRAIDARGLSDDVLSGRPISPQAVEGLLYESAGGRVTVEVARGARVYSGYSRDRNNRDAAPTGRTLVGGYAGNVAGTGLDISGSNSLIHRPTGRYHSRYISVGRQLGRRAYVSGDYSTSLSVVRFSRSDGLTIETRPRTTRFSATTTINIDRSLSLLATLERTAEDGLHETRALTGLTYRLR